MALFTLSDLTTPATREDVQAAIYRVLETVGIDTTSWHSGAVVRSMTVATSVVLAALSQLQARIAASGFLDLSNGEWLTLVARYVYGVERIEATFASGTVKLTNAGGGVFAVDAGDLIVASSADGKTYRSTAAFSLPAGGTVTVPVVATEAGSASTAAVGELSVMVTTLLQVTATNEAVLVGTDEERDPALRTRCREKLGSLSPNGPWDAYAYAARASKRQVVNAGVTDYVTTGITRTRVSRDGYGNVTLTVANNTGLVTGVAGDLATDIGAVDDAVQRQAAPLAVNATVQSATPVSVSVQYAVHCYNTVRRTNAEVLALVDAALVEFFRTQPIGGNTLTPADTIGRIYADAIRTTIGAVLPQIFHVELAAPTADISLTGSQVAVYTGSTGSTVQQHLPPEGSAAA